MATRFLVRRLVQLVPVLLGVSVIAFLIMHLAPGDPLLLLLPPDAPLSQLEEMRVGLGLDQPLPIQYAKWLGAVAQGDLGKSYHGAKPVIDLILGVFPATVLLTVSSLAFAILAGIPLGILAAIRRGTWVDRVTMVVAVLGWSMPPFWIGLVLIILFAVQLGWLPTGGMYGFADTGPTPAAVLRHLILPTVTLGARHMSYVARLTRSSMLEVLGNDYIRTAHGKGLPARIVIIRHALRNALTPVVTAVGVSVGRLLGGAVVVETVFAWPGIGSLVVKSILNRDFPVVQGSILFLATVFVLVNLIVDYLYLLIDPRVRHA